MADAELVSDVGVPVYFLHLRSQLVKLRELADVANSSDETKAVIDELLARTQPTTTFLLGETQIPDGQPLDAMFSDDFLRLCKLMRVDAGMSWLRQPSVTMRLANPEAILARWQQILDSDDSDFGELPESTSFDDYLSSVKESLESSYAILRRHNITNPIGEDL